MPELSLYNIDQISLDVSGQEITFSHLPADLIDHICCDVENEMKSGLTFSQAYMRVKQKMGSRRLKEIQEETLYSVDTNYRNMKNLMKFSGIAGTILFGFAALFKIQHWPMAGFMMTGGAIILSLVFLPSALYVLWRETHNSKRLFVFISGFLAGVLFITGTLFKIQHWSGAAWLLLLAYLSGIIVFLPALTIRRYKDQENPARRPVYIVGAIGIFFYTTGMLFKIQHWPLATIYMITGVLLSGVIALPWYTWLTWKDENSVSARFIYIIAGSLSLIVPGFMINLNLQNSYNNGYYINQSQQQALYNYTYNMNEEFLASYSDSLNYKKMEELHSRTKVLLAAISNIQMKMIDESEGIIASSQEVTQVGLNEGQPENHFNRLSGPFVSSTNFLLPGSSLLQELDSAIQGYLSYVSNQSSESSYKNYEKMLDPELFMPSPDVKTVTLMSALHSTELLKNSLLSFEARTLKLISRNKFK